MVKYHVKLTVIHNETINLNLYVSIFGKSAHGISSPPANLGRRLFNMDLLHETNHDVLCTQNSGANAIRNA